MCVCFTIINHVNGGHEAYEGSVCFVMLSPSGGRRCELPQAARFGHRLAKECVGRAREREELQGDRADDSMAVWQTRLQEIPRNDERSSGVENSQTREELPPREGSPIRGCLRDNMIVMRRAKFTPTTGRNSLI